MKIGYLFLLLFIHSILGLGQNNILINIDSRLYTSLNGTWNYIMDPYETGYYDYRYQPYDANENTRTNRSAYYNNAQQQNKRDRVEYNFDQSPTILVPGDWNSQDDKLLYYEGTIWYKRSFDYQKKDEDHRVFIYFGAVNYKAEVYLNGEKLGVHEGGFTPFNFEITNIVKLEDNYLVVKVENTRRKDRIPTINTDWWNYGGITRSVGIVETPQIFVNDYFIQLAKGSRNKISGYVQLSNKIKGEKLSIDIPELHYSGQFTTDASGKANIDISLSDVSLWSPENPMLYNVKISAGEDAVEDKIGFRNIEVSGEKILLNGEEIFLRGICMHEENTMRGGRAHSEADALVALNWAKDMNCNFMRLAHYPHNEEIVRMADELGMLLWSEIPVYWTVDFTSDKVYENAQQQLEEMVDRDKNRASVIIWSMANETPQSTPRNQFLEQLINTTRKMDNTRLISAALQHRHDDRGVNIIDDPISNQVDIVAFNQYIGWYGGNPDDLPDVKWEFDQNKPVIISEFGAGALGGYHADKETIWSEEYQEYLYLQTIEMMKNIPELQGVTPWILADFRSPKRNLPGIQDGWNRKGLISNNGQKKKAFFVMKDWYGNIKKS